MALAECPGALGATNLNIPGVIPESGHCVSQAGGRWTDLAAGCAAAALGPVFLLYRCEV